MRQITQLKRAAAVNIISEGGRPMTVKEIFEKLERLGYANSIEVTYSILNPLVSEELLTRTNERPTRYAMAKETEMRKCEICKRVTEHKITYTTKPTKLGEVKVKVAACTACGNTIDVVVFDRDEPKTNA